MFVNNCIHFKDKYMFSIYMFIPSLTESRRSAVTLRSSKKDFFSLDDWHEDPDEEEAMIKRAR